MGVIANHGRFTRGVAIFSITENIFIYKTEHSSDSENDSKEPLYETEVCHFCEGMNPLHRTVDSR
jgi:hypothetical protein